MPQSPIQVYQRRVEQVRRLKEVAARFRSKGQPLRAEVFEELLVNAEKLLAETPKYVRVGDHTPEPRVEHGPLIMTQDDRDFLDRNRWRM